MKSAILSGAAAVVASHPTRGAWIEIMSRSTLNSVLMSRTPHGVRGLKYLAVRHIPERHRSHPTRGAWIEMFRQFVEQNKGKTSHPTRGAWIEIAPPPHLQHGSSVAPHTGCVD